jgi:hypothetical protein
MNGRVAIKRTLPEPVHFERLFVNRRTVLIFDPSVVSLVPLVRDNAKRPVGIVGFGFDDPSGHGDTSTRII